MIIYIFNGYFPDPSGFGQRCLREIKALSKVDEVTVLCRQNTLINKLPSLDTVHPINIVYFSSSSTVIDRPKNYKGTGWYELKRNFGMMISLGFNLIKLTYKYKRKSIKLYCVTSPLTVPILVLFLSKLTGSEARVITFHDLEPELAIHLKKIPWNHWLVRLELFLEKIVCIGFKKIIVTSHSQAERLIKRNKINPKKIEVIPNTTDIRSRLGTVPVNIQSQFQKNDFILVYMSTLSFDYTISGLNKFLSILKEKKQEFPQLKLLIIGGGVGLPIVLDNINKLSLKKEVICTDKVQNPAPLLKLADAALIPWEKDEMTETIFPTKLLEFMSLGLPVIAPNYGEFKSVLKHGQNGFNYTNFNEIFNFIKKFISDKNLKKHMGKNAYILFEKKYSVEKLNKRFLNFYR